MNDLPDRRSEYNRLRDAMRSGAAPAASTITDDQIRPPEGEVESARSPAVMERLNLGLIRAWGDTDTDAQEVMAKAMRDSGTSPEMLRQMADSPEFIPTLERLMMATVYYSMLPGVMAAMASKALAGDSRAASLFLSQGDKMKNLSLDDEVKNLVRADDMTILREFENLRRDLDAQMDEMTRDHQMTDKAKAAEKEAALRVTQINRDMQKRRR